MKKVGSFLGSMFKVGCIGFGGGSALIPIMEQEVIREQKIDKEENYDKDVMIASITPGAFTVKLASSLGGRNFGMPVMFLGAVLMALPGVVFAILCLSVLTFAQGQILSAVQTLSIGVSAFIVCLLLEYIVQVFLACRKEGSERLGKAVFLMVAVFLLASGGNIYKVLRIEGTPVFALSTVHILITAFFCVIALRGELRGRLVPLVLVLVFLYYLIHGKAEVIQNPYVSWTVNGAMLLLTARGIWKECQLKNAKAVGVKVSLKETGIWMGILLITLLIAFLIEPDILKFAWKGIVSAVFSFGGGSAYFAVADGFFVDSGIITYDQFYGQIVNVINILPGSVLCKALAAVGFCAGVNGGHARSVALLYAVVGFLISVCVSCGMFQLLYALYDRVRILKIFQMLHRWIRPIIAGLLMNIIFTIIDQCIRTAEVIQISGKAVLMYLIVFSAGNLLGRKKVKSGVLLLGNVLCIFLLAAVLRG